MKKVKVLMLSAALLCGIGCGPVRATLEGQFAGSGIVDSLSKSIPNPIVDTATELTSLQTTLATYQSPTPDALPGAVTGAQTALTAALGVFGGGSGLLDFGSAGANTYGLLGVTIQNSGLVASAHPLPPIAVGNPPTTKYAALEVLQASYVPDRVTTAVGIYPLATGGASPAAGTYYFDNFIATLQSAKTLSALQKLMDWDGSTPGLKQYAGAFRNLLSHLQSDLTALAEFNHIFRQTDMIGQSVIVYQAQTQPNVAIQGADYGYSLDAPSNLAVPTPRLWPDSTDVLAWYNGVAGLHQAIEMLRKQVNAASAMNKYSEVIHPLLASNASVTDPQYGLSAQSLKTKLSAVFSTGLLVDVPAKRRPYTSGSLAGWINYQLTAPIPAQKLPATP